MAPPTQGLPAAESLQFFVHKLREAADEVALVGGVRVDLEEEERAGSEGEEDQKEDSEEEEGVQITIDWDEKRMQVNVSNWMNEL